MWRLREGERLDNSQRECKTLHRVRRAIYFVVAVKEIAEDGKANDAVIRALAEHLQIEPYQLRISSGHNARKKIIEIL